MAKSLNLILFFSIISLILLSSLASASIGSSLFSLDYSSPYDEFITAMEDSGTDDLNSVSSTELVTWENFDSKSILEDNEKNSFSLSFDPESSVFLVDDSNWLNVLKATTLAIHYESTLTSCKLSSCNGELLPLKVSPLFILSGDYSLENSESDVSNINSFLKEFSKDRGLNLYSFGEISSSKKSSIESDSSLSISELSSDLRSYLEQWTSSFSTVVVIPSSKEDDPLAYEIGLQAAVIASSLGVPLVSLDEKKFKSKRFPSVKRVILVSRNGGIKGLYKKQLKDYFPFAFNNDNIRELVISDVPNFISKVNFLRPNVFGEGTYSLPLTHKRIVFNPEDISSSVCSSNSNSCKDSLIVPYLALVHNQHLVSTKVASYLINKDGSDGDSLITDSKKAISSSLTNFPVVDSTVPQYTTFVGSPAVLPLKYINGLFPADLAILMKEQNLDESSLSNLFGRGRLYANSREILSSQIMSSLFLPLGTNSFVSIINNSESPDAFHVTSDASFYDSIFDNVSVFSANNFSLSLINSSYRSSLSGSLKDSVSSDILFLEDVSFGDDFKFESSPFVFLVKSNSTNISCLDVISKGASACIGFENSFEASSKFKFLPQIYQYNYGSNVLFGDLSSFIYHNYYFQRNASYSQLTSKGSDEDSSSVEQSAEFDLSHQQLILFGDPLVPFASKNGAGLVQDKIKFNESNFAPSSSYYSFDKGSVYFNSYFKNFNFLFDDTYVSKQYFVWDELSPGFSEMIFPLSSSHLKSNNLELSKRLFSSNDLSVDLSSEYLDSISPDSSCSSESDPDTSGLINCNLSFKEKTFDFSDSDLFVDSTLSNTFFVSNDPSIFVSSKLPLFIFDDSKFHISLDDSFSKDLVIRSKFNDGLFIFDGKVSFCIDPSVYEVPGSDSDPKLEAIESENKNLIKSSISLNVFSNNLFSDSLIKKNISSKESVQVNSDLGSVFDSLSFVPDKSVLNSSVDSDLCFISDLSSFDFVDSDLSSFISTHKEHSLVDQLIFDISFDSFKGKVSEEYLSPSILALSSSNSNLDLSDLDYASLNLDDYFISRGPLKIEEVSVENLPGRKLVNNDTYRKLISDVYNYNFILGQEYFIDDSMVIYIGDNTFFNYYLTKGYILNESGVYEGLNPDKPDYAKKLYSLSKDLNLNGINGLNKFVSESMYRWGISEAEDPLVDSRWYAKMNMVYEPGRNPETVKKFSNGEFIRSYDCIGFTASAVEVHFPKDNIEGSGNSFLTYGYTFTNFINLLKPFNYRLVLFGVKQSSDRTVYPEEGKLLSVSSGDKSQIIKAIYGDLVRDKEIEIANLTRLTNYYASHPNAEAEANAVDDYVDAVDDYNLNDDDDDDDYAPDDYTDDENYEYYEYQLRMNKKGFTLYTKILSGGADVLVFNSKKDLLNSYDHLLPGVPVQLYNDDLTDAHSFLHSEGIGTIEAHVGGTVSYYGQHSYPFSFTDEDGDVQTIHKDPNQLDSIFHAFMVPKGFYPYDLPSEHSQESYDLYETPLV